MGLGHVRRNLLIAQFLAGGGLEATILMICGAYEAGAFLLPPGVDCVTLPALRKQTSGHYDSRRLSLTLRELIGLRARTVQAALEAFRPHLLVTDNVPRGALGELEPALESLRASGFGRCVLGLRDVLDEPAVVCAEWRRARNEEAIRDYYEEIWVYGDPEVYDLARECAFAPDIAAKIRYLGYLDQRPRLDFVPAGHGQPDQGIPAGPFALCTVGGGQDGVRLAEAFARARPPAGVERVILAGPDMAGPDRERLWDYTRRDPGLKVMEFVPEPAPLVERAGCVVGMAGYNTVCEVLSFGKRALLVPRVEPRREQLIRAERLQRLGLLDMLHPDALDARALTRWMRGNFGLRSQACLDLGGLPRLVRAVREVLAPPRRPSESHPLCEVQSAS
jgi:predicted glycosyltransferase